MPKIPKALLLLLFLPITVFFTFFIKEGVESVPAFLGLLLFFIFTLSYSFYRIGFSLSPSQKIWSVLFFVLAFSLRWIHLQDRSLWMDEDEQVGEILGYAFGQGISDMVGIAARTQQPPLDYFLEAIGLKFFGASELGARFHACVLGSLSVVIFFWTLLTPLALLPSLLGTLLMAFHPDLILYSQIGRPYSTALLFFLLVLLGHFLHYQSQCHQRKTPSPFHLLFLFSSQVLFLFSIGLSPPLVLLTLLLCTSPLVLAGPEKRKLWGQWVFTTFLSLLLFLPYQINIILQSGPYLKKDRLWSLDVFDFPSYLNFFTAFLPGEGHPVFFYLPFLFAPVLLSPFLGLFLFNLIYPLLFLLVFRYFIQWELLPRYFLTLIPVLLANFAWATDSLGKWREKSLLRFAALLFPLFSLGYFLAHFPGLPGKGSAFPYYPEWKIIFEYLKKNSTQRDAAYLLPLGPVSEWPLDAFPARMIYYHDEKSRRSAPLDSHWEWDGGKRFPPISRDLERNPDHFFILFGFFHGEQGQLQLPVGTLAEQLGRDLPVELFSLEGKVLRPLTPSDPQRTGIFLARIGNRRGTVPTLKIFLNHLERASGEQESSFKIYQWQFFLGENSLGKLRRINVQGRLDDVIRYYEELHLRRGN